MDNDNEKMFTYTYSAKKQDEVERILKKYIPKEESAIEKIQHLDRQVECRGRALAITLGIVGTLLLGTGMSCIMELSGYFAIGIVIGIVGIMLIISAYPIFKKVTKIQRMKIAPQIIELSKKMDINNI